MRISDWSSDVCSSDLGVLHDVAGFSGIAERGPVASAVRVESVEEFERVFGGPVQEGFLAPSVHLFFDNGGRAAWIVRVAHAETMATARAFVTRERFPTLRVEADGKGTRLNSSQQCEPRKQPTA